jgi:uncharacterized cupredoxin-like copper-binding protein
MTNRRKTRLAAIGLATVGAITGPVVAGSGAATSVGVSGKEFKFTLTKSSARHGSITFTLKNTGKIGHDFKIDGKKTPIIKPKKTASITVNLKKGTYKYLCTVPGHASSGMKGTFKVT